MMTKGENFADRLLSSWLKIKRLKIVPLYINYDFLLGISYAAKEKRDL